MQCSALNLCNMQDQTCLWARSPALGLPRLLLEQKKGKRQEARSQRLDVQVSREVVSHTNPDHRAKLWLHSPSSGGCTVQTPPLRAGLLLQRPLWNTGLHPHFLQCQVQGVGVGTGVAGSSGGLSQPVQSTLLKIPKCGSSRGWMCSL